MSYKVLARKWRPKLFKEVIGQEHITMTLINSVKSSKIAHAYLLTGTRGIGKTSIARIFAKAIRCNDLAIDGEPCLKCQSCIEIEDNHSLDYLEIDGASNNSVENIRDLIESAQYLPSHGNYKVYVIDEVHMLSTSAFNALLKTLEEPPKHVVFIFATTDPQKLLGTVLSRCQRFDFKNSTQDLLKKHILKIAQEEGIQLESDEIALELAKQGKGSVRDTLSLLDQVVALSNGQVVDFNTLNLSLGLVSHEVVGQLISAVFKKKKEEIHKTFELLLQNNVNLNLFSQQLLNHLYEIIVSMNENGRVEARYNIDGLTGVSIVELLWIYENLSRDIAWSLTSLSPENNFCFSLIKMVLREKIVSADDTQVSLKKNFENETLDYVESKIEAEEEEVKESLSSVVEVQEDIVEDETSLEKDPINDYSWDDFIKFLYQKHKSLALNLERGNLLNLPVLGQDQMTFNIAFGPDCKIFYDFLNETGRKKELSTLLAEFLGKTKENIYLTLQILNEEEKEEVNFRSSLEIEEMEYNNKLETQRKEILNSKYIKDAESLFNSKVNKIILNEENK